MRDVDAFENAYDRLRGTRVVVASIREQQPDEPMASVRQTPRSRLLPRLALLAPRKAVSRRTSE